MQHSVQSEAGRIETALVEGAPHIRLYGECDISLVEQLQEQLAAQLESGPSQIVFDLTAATFLDSSILRVFLVARRELTTPGGEVVILCRPGFVRRLLSLLEMDRLVRICTPEEWRQSVACLH